MERKETSPPVQGGCIYRPLETTANLGIYAAETMPTGSGEALGYAVWGREGTAMTAETVMVCCRIRCSECQHVLSSWPTDEYVAENRDASRGKLPVGVTQKDSTETGRR